MSCGSITKNLTLNRCKASIAQISDTIVIINFDDVNKTKSDVDGNVIAELVLNEGAQAYKYVSARNAFESTTTLNKGTYVNTYSHQILGRVFFRSQEVKDQLVALTNGKVIVIVKNLDTTNEETVYEVYGWDSGLVLTDFQQASTDSDGVLYTITLASDDNSKESQLPLSFYAGSLAETETAIEGLLAEA